MGTGVDAMPKVVVRRFGVPQLSAWHRWLLISNIARLLGSI